MSTMASKINGVLVVCYTVVQAQIKENIKLRITGLCEGKPLVFPFGGVIRLLYFHDVNPGCEYLIVLSPSVYLDAWCVFVVQIRPGREFQFEHWPVQALLTRSQS